MKAFCQYCGEQSGVREKIEYYDRRTGKPVLSYWATCPTMILSKWWQRIFNHHFYEEWVGGYDPRPINC